MAALDPAKVKIAVGRIRSCYDGELVNQALRAGIELRYAGAHVNADSIEDQLYTNNPDDALAGYRGRLSSADRQRCLMALLATRKEAFPLAIHMYIGLMEWVSPDEIKNILFLTGVYMGVPTFVAGI